MDELRQVAAASVRIKRWPHQEVAASSGGRIKWWGARSENASQVEQNEDRDRHAEEPEQNVTHDHLRLSSGCRHQRADGPESCGRLSGCSDRLLGPKCVGSRSGGQDREPIIGQTAWRGSSGRCMRDCSGGIKSTSRTDETAAAMFGSPMPKFFCRGRTAQASQRLRRL